MTTASDSQKSPPVVLAIAGSDSGAGAGVQADLKAIHANRGYAVTVVTATTAQNTTAVREVHHLPAAVVRAQLYAVLDDFPVAAIKTGMLPTAKIVEVVADAIARSGIKNVVVDPLMLAESGAPLVTPEATAALRERLLPLARVVTPNRAEASALTGTAINDIEDLARAAETLRQSSGIAAVVATGGHFDGPDAVDLVVTEEGTTRLENRRLPALNTHGTGCTFASALATRLAHGDEIATAAAAAKDFTSRAIAGGLAIGSGTGPVDVRWSDA